MALSLLLLSGSTQGGRQGKEPPGFSRHYDRGLALYKAGRYTDALAELQAAYDIWSLPDLLFNIAQTQRRLGDKRTALVSYERYLKESRSNARGRADAEHYAAELRASLPPEQPTSAEPETTPPQEPSALSGPEMPTPATEQVLPSPPPQEVPRAARAPARSASPPATPPTALLLFGGPAGRRPAWRIGTGAAAMAAGAGLVGLGAWGIAVDGSCAIVPHVYSTGRTCGTTYSTLALGAGSLGAGAALLVTGIVLIAIPGPRRPAVRTGVPRGQRGTIHPSATL